MSKPQKLSQLDPKLQKVFKKMFDIVGAPHDMKLSDHWWSKYSWNEKQEKEFREWFIQYHWKGKGKNGNGALSKSAKTKKACQTAYLWFNLNYGWRRNDVL